MLLKFQRIRDNKYRFICKLHTTFKTLQNILSEKYNLYRQRIIFQQEFVEFGKTVFDVKIIGEIPENG